MNTDIEKKLKYANVADTRSSVFERLTADMLRRVNLSIIERDPPTFKAVHRRYQLETLGVGYHAFYRYARRLRAEAALFELAGLTAPPEADVPALLPRLLAQRLLETLAFEDASPRQIQRLTDAYRASITALTSIRRHQLFPKRKGAGESADELASLLTEYRALVEKESSAIESGKEDREEETQTD